MAGERTYDDVVAENAALRTEIEALRAKVAALEKLIGRNSSNSSMPPSTDPLSERRAQAQNRAARRATKRKPGKQPGTEGRHLAQVADPDVVLTHTPAACEGCGADLADAPTAGVETRQVFDLPEPGLVCTEHRAQRRRCSCGETTTARFPSQATAPACYGPRVRANGLYLLARQHIPFERAAEAMADLFGVNCSTGFLDALYSEAAEGLDGFLAEVLAQLTASEVVHMDETGDRVGTSSWWFHVASTNRLTLLHADRTRGKAGVEATGVLPGFAGTAVHDRLGLYFDYTNATHAVCNAHLLRNLASVGVVWNQTDWAEAMTALLCEMRDAADRALSSGRENIEAPELSSFLTRYDDIVASAFAANPEPASGRKRNTVERESYNLAVAFGTHRDAICRFATDLRVPFTNNQAERDLRMAKLHRKISGCFRAPHGAERLAAVRSYISTAAKHRIGALDVLVALFTGTPWMPPAPARP